MTGNALDARSVNGHGAVPSAGVPHVLEVANLHTVFATSEGPVKAVEDVSFGINAGETLGIVGESGSGKSVLVRSVMNLLPPTSTVTGDVRFNGRQVDAMGRRELRHFWGPQMAMVFQNPMTSLNPVKKIGQQIVDPIRYHLGTRRVAARERAAELLRLVGISDVKRCLTQYPHQLSGGMRQRVAIAIALSCEPRLLIADEPTTALDVTVQKQILDLLTSLQSELGMAMILISHDLGVVAGRAQDIGVMYAGRLVEIGSASEVFDHPKHRYTAALLASTPQMSSASHTRLPTIPGSPPNLLYQTVGCPFAPRCRHADQVCSEDKPEFIFETSRRGFACHHPVGHTDSDIQGL